MYTQKAPTGARVGAFFLDLLFLNLALAVLLYFSYYLYFIISPFAALLYFGLCEGGSMSASPGKKLCGLIVVDSQGAPLDSGKAFLRSLCRLLSGLILGVGFLIGLFNEDGRAMHDRMAGTFVAVRQPAPANVSPKPPQQPQPVQRSGAMMTAQLIGISGQFAGQSFQVPTQGILLGRDRASCDFVFPESTKGISRNHCKLQYNPQTQMFVLYDLGSSYGTFLGSGVQVPQGQPAALRPGDEFYLASRANVFRVSL